MTASRFSRTLIIAFLLTPFALLFILPAGRLLVDGLLTIPDTWSAARAPRQWMLLGKSALLSAVTASLVMLLARIPAEWCRRSQFKGRRLMLMVGLLPLLIPTVIHAASWIFAFGETGIFTRGLDGVSIMNIPHLAVVMIWTVSLLPAGVIVHCLAASREQAPAEEAARLLPLRRLDRLRIQWGLSSMIQTTGAAVIAIAVFNAAVIPGFFGIDMFAGEVMADFAGGRNAAEVAALSLPALLLSTLLLIWVINSQALARLAGGRLRDTASDPLAPRHWRSTIIALLFFLGAGLPLLVLCMESRWLSRVPPAFMLSLDEISNGLINAGLTAIVAGVIGLSLGLASRLMMKRKTVLRSLDILATIPLILPHSLSAAALVQFWAQPGWRSMFYDSVFLQPLGLGLIYSPFVYWAMRTAFRTIPDSMSEAAQLSGLSTARRIWSIDIGMSWPWIATGIGIAGAAALTEIQAAQMLYRPGSQTLPIRIYDLLHYGRNADMAAMCVILILMAVLMAGAWISFIQCQRLKRVHG